MKKVISIFMIGYFIALGGGATLVTHYCGGDHVFTLINPAASEKSCCNKDNEAQKAGCSDEGKACSGQQKEQHSCHSKAEDCQKACCVEEVITFKLAELTQPARILPEGPAVVDIFSLSPLYTDYILFSASKHFEPALYQYAGGPPPLEEPDQPVLSVFLL